MAEESALNSKDIAAKLKNMIDRIEEAGSTSREAEKAFGEIKNEIIKVTDGFIEVSKGMYELESGGSQILDAVNNLRDYSLQG